MNLLDLPVDIFKVILDYTSFESLKTLRATNRALCSIISPKLFHTFVLDVSNPDHVRLLSKLEYVKDECLNVVVDGDSDTEEEDRACKEEDRLEQINVDVLSPFIKKLLVLCNHVSSKKARQTLRRNGIIPLLQRLYNLERIAAYLTNIPAQEVEYVAMLKSLCPSKNLLEVAPSLKVNIYYDNRLFEERISPINVEQSLFGLYNLTTLEIMTSVQGSKHVVTDIGEIIRSCTHLTHLSILFAVRSYTNPVQVPCLQDMFIPFQTCELALQDLNFNNIGCKLKIKSARCMPNLKRLTLHDVFHNMESHHDINITLEQPCDEVEELKIYDKEVCLWTALDSATVWLNSIIVDTVDQTLLHYLQSPDLVGILQHIKLMNIQNEETSPYDLATSFWRVLLSHSQQLKSLTINPPYFGNWCWTPSSIAAEMLSHFTKLSVLAMCPASLSARAQYKRRMSEEYAISHAKDFVQACLGYGHLKSVELFTTTRKLTAKSIELRHIKRGDAEHITAMSKVRLEVMPNFRVSLVEGRRGKTVKASWLPKYDGLDSKWWMEEERDAWHVVS